MTVVCVFQVCSPEEQWMRGIFSTEDKAKVFQRELDVKLDLEARQRSDDRWTSEPDTTFIEEWPIDKPKLSL